MSLKMNSDLPRTVDTFREPPLISSVDQAAHHILILNKWLADDSGKINASLRNVRRWYAMFEPCERRWLFGFSKFIGYEAMTAERYHKYTRSPGGERERLDGRATEDKRKALWQKSRPVDQDLPLYRELYEPLCDFLSSQGLKKPRSDHSIRILQGYAREDEGKA